MKKVALVLVTLVALLPAAVFADEGGPHRNYEALVPGETWGLFAILVAAILLFVKLRASRSTLHASRITALTLSLLSGVLLYLSFPPFDLGWLAWIALVPMIVAQLHFANPKSSSRAGADAPHPVPAQSAEQGEALPHRTSPQGGAARDIIPNPNIQSPITNVQLPNLYQALTIFITYALVFMHVFPSELPTGFPVPVWPLILIGIAFVSVVSGLTGLPAGSLAFHRKTNFRFFIIGPALSWMGLEQLRVVTEMGQSWARIPATQHANIPLIQLATFGGEWLVGALVIAANYALALLAYRLWPIANRASSNEQYAIRDRRYAMTTLALVLGAHLVGNALINTPSETVRVAAIQLGEDLGDSPNYMTYWNRADWKGMDEAVLRDFEPMIRAAGARGAKVIAMPEAVLWVDPATDLSLVARLTNLAKETGAYITFTFYLWDDPNSRNEVYTATPRGEWLGPYAKNHPIAYIGEYSVTAGKFPVFETPYGGLGNFVCYDNTYTDVAARLARGGASLLTSSNHDWPEGAWGFYTQSIYRAAENRTAIVRADWRVGSAIIDPFGRVLATAKLDEREKTILVADVPIIRERGTVYTRFGDWIAYMGLAALAAMWLLGLSWPRRLRPMPAPTSSTA